MSKAPRIRLFTTSDCPHCRQMKDYLRQRNIAFSEQDIEKSARAFAEFQQLGGRTVPILIVADLVIRGFDQEKLSKTLQNYGLIRS